MTPPPGSTQGPRLDKAEADRIAEAHDIRTYPVPPRKLLSERPQDSDDYDGLLDRAVAPHWNSAVDLLRAGPEGYLALTRLRDRLADESSRLGREGEQVSLPAEIARRVHRVLSYEAERYGAESTLAASIPDRPEASGMLWWSWEPRWSLDQEHAPISFDDPPALFVLRSPDIDGLVSEYAGTGTLVEFERDTTWASNLSRVSDAGLWYSDVSALSRYVDELVEFRLKVVEQVLREHEVLGHVQEFGEGEPRRAVLSDEQTTFLDVALAAIGAVEAEVDDPTSPAKGRRSWSNVSAKMHDKTGWSGNRLEGIAQNDFGLFGGPAFVKREGRGSGPLTRAEEADRYALFCRVMRAYDRARRGV